jgi:MYXO-CTERM domain-containing protein
MNTRIATTLAAAACLTAGAAADHIVTYAFELGTEQTNPAADLPDGFDPTGFAVVNINTRDNAIDWVIDYEGLTGAINAPGAHFHGPAPLGSNGGLQVDIVGDFAGTGSGAALGQPASGTLTGMYDQMTDQQISDILAGLWYINIHTDMNPAGELRGQVVPAPGALAIAGLGGLVAARRRRR